MVDLNQNPISISFFSVTGPRPGSNPHGPHPMVGDPTLIGHRPNPGPDSKPEYIIVCLYMLFIIHDHVYSIYDVHGHPIVDLRQDYQWGPKNGTHTQILFNIIKILSSDLLFFFFFS